MSGVKVFSEESNIGDIALSSFQGINSPLKNTKRKTLGYGATPHLKTIAQASPCIYAWNRRRPPK